MTAQDEIQAQVQTILVASSAVINLVPAERIKAPGNWQNLARPYVIHFPVSCSVSHTHDGGLMPLRDWDFYQVSVFADSYTSGDKLARAVRTALDGLHQLGSPVTDAVKIFYRGGPWYLGKEPDTEVHHFAPQFEVFEAL